MSLDTAVIETKVERAQSIVETADADAWVTFCRETDTIHEPCLPYLLGFDVVWPTAVVIRPEASAVVLGRHDAPTAEKLGVHEVYAYDESIREPLRETLAGAETIALNYDTDDNVADGLTHGLYRRLRELLPDRTFVSAGPLVRQMRGIKSDVERERITRAAETTLEIEESVVAEWTPDMTEQAFADACHERMRDRGLGSAWAWDYCPTVHMGGDAVVGHTTPGDRTVEEGGLLHVDFGVVRDDYAADLQRVWVRGEPSEGLQAAFADVRAAIRAGNDRLAAGVPGHAVDRVARETITDRGWDAFDHAFGHQVGRTAHDGGTLLGPEWDRYGEAPRHEVQVGEIYTMELGVDTEWGYVGQEEMVHVTENGPEWIVPPQTELRRL